MIEQNTVELNFDAFKINQDITRNDNNSGLEMPKLRTEQKPEPLRVHTPSLDIEIEENKATVTPNLETEYTIQFENLKDWENLVNIAKDIVNFNYSPMDFSLDNLKVMLEKLKCFDDLRKNISSNLFPKMPILIIANKHDKSDQIVISG